VLSGGFSLIVQDGVSRSPSSSNDPDASSVTLSPTLAR
jgi:hypothetical protein